MSDRATIISQRLAGSPWAGWHRDTMTGDASARRYHRLRDPQTGQTRILMDAPPETCGPLTPFIHVAGLLRDRAFSAPEIHEIWADDGLMVLEDLGPTLLADAAAAAPNSQPALYEAAIDLLVALHREAAPASLTRHDTSTTLSRIGLAWEWYAPGSDSGPAFAALGPMLDTAFTTPPVLAMMDYHAENIVWRPDRDGLARLGLLDFQDAAAHHPGFDLTSILRDARRDLPEALRAALTARYIAATGCDPTTFRRDLALMGVVRNLRILGIFARLSRRDGKPGYLAHLPRVWAHLSADLRHPALAKTIAAPVLATLPAPGPAVLERLRHDT